MTPYIIYPPIFDRCLGGICILRDSFVFHLCYMEQMFICKNNIFRCGLLDHSAYRELRILFDELLNNFLML